MANNYLTSSTMIDIPPDKIVQAESIVSRVQAELEGADEEPVGYLASFEEDGLWIRHDESINVENAEKLFKAIVEELELPGIFVCSWAYTCSRPILDAFGGGAFAVQKGKETVWVDATAAALAEMENAD